MCIGRPIKRVQWQYTGWSKSLCAPDDYVRSSTDNTIITTHVFLASLLGSIWLLGSRPSGPGGH
jgi:hypothetical protein